MSRWGFVFSAHSRASGNPGPHDLRLGWGKTWACAFAGASGKAGLALALGVGLALAAGPASAQIRLPPDHCEGALFIAERIKERYDISPRLAASFQRFRLSNCDTETSFERDTEVDVTAFAEFRLRFEAWKICSADPMRRRCQ